MTPRARMVDTAGFATLVLLSLGLLWWRWNGQPAGLSADQTESLALARSWVDGHGLRLTAWSSPSPGPANLLWLTLQAGLLWAGASPEEWLPRIAVLGLGLALVVVSFRGAWVWRRSVQLQDAFPAVGLSLASATVEAAALGSGAVSWVLALAVAAVLVGRGVVSGRTRWSAMVLGLCCWLTPATVWLLLMATPARWLAAKVAGRPATRETLRFCAGGLLAVGLVLGVRTALLGPFPAEGLWPSDDGAAQTFEFVGRQSRWLFGALAATLVAAVWRRFHMRGGATVLAWVLTTLVLASWTAAPRWLFLGCVPLLAMLMSDGLSAARQATTVAGDGVQRWLSWSAFIALTVLLALASTASYALGPIMAASSAPVPRPEIQAAFEQRGLRQPLVAWADAAQAAALFPQARVVVVKYPSAALEDLLLSEGPPDLVDPQISLDHMPRLAAVMSLGAGEAWWLSEQSPDEDPRCPEGRLALLSTTPVQLGEQLEADVAQDQPGRALSRWRCALAALEPVQLPAQESRRALAQGFAARSLVFEGQGRLELACRAAALAASVGGEGHAQRSRAEQLRAAWLDSSKVEGR